MLRYHERQRYNSGDPYTDPILYSIEIRDGDHDVRLLGRQARLRPRVGGSGTIRRACLYT